jgi:predicted  nucleic acid-binding Zn-ribbon protein
VALLTPLRKVRCLACVVARAKTAPPEEEADLELPGQVQCPYCGRLMSQREKQEQGACNDCQDPGRKP